MRISHFDVIFVCIQYCIYMRTLVIIVLIYIVIIVRFSYLYCICFYMCGIFSICMQPFRMWHCCNLIEPLKFQLKEGGLICMPYGILGHIPLFPFPSLPPTRRSPHLSLDCPGLLCLRPCCRPSCICVTQLPLVRAYRF